MRISWSPLAVDRLSEIADYISRDNPQAAVRWVEAVFKTVQRLLLFPESGRCVPEVGRKDIREIIHGNYRIVYRLEAKAIFVLTVRHGKQVLPIDEIP